MITLHLTNAALTALADGQNRAMRAVQIRSIQIGDGTGAGDAADAAPRVALRSRRQTVPIGGTTDDRGHIELQGTLTSSTALAVTEVGVMARIGDDGAEFLFAYWAAPATSGAAVTLADGLTVALVVGIVVARSAAELSVTLAPDVRVGRRVLLAGDLTVPRDRYLSVALASDLTDYRWLEISARNPSRMYETAVVPVGDVEYTLVSQHGAGPAAFGDNRHGDGLRALDTGTYAWSGVAPSSWCCSLVLPTGNVLTGAVMVGAEMYMVSGAGGGVASIRRWSPGSNQQVELVDYAATMTSGADRWGSRPTYDITAYGGHLYWHDLSDTLRRVPLAGAETAAVIGATQAATLNGSGIAATPAGVLYVVGEHTSQHAGRYQLYTADRGTGVLTRVAELSPQPARLPTLAWTDRLWLYDRSAIYTVDVATGAMTRRAGSPSGGDRVLLGAWRVDPLPGHTFFTRGAAVDGGILAYWQRAAPRVLHLQSVRADRDVTPVEVVGLL